MFRLLYAVPCRTVDAEEVNPGVFSTCFACSMPFCTSTQPAHGCQRSLTNAFCAAPLNVPMDVKDTTSVASSTCFACSLPLHSLPMDATMPPHSLSIDATQVRPSNRCCLPKRARRGLVRNLLSGCCVGEHGRIDWVGELCRQPHWVMCVLVWEIRLGGRAVQTASLGDVCVSMGD